MKKLIFKVMVAMMVAVIAVVMVACGNSKSEGSVDDSTVVEDVVVGDLDTAKVDKLPKVIDLYATWCGPCKMIAPIIEELKGEYAGVVEFEKVDVDENLAIAEQYEVQSIPTLIFMKPDGSYEKREGFMDKEAIKVEIAKMIE